MRALGLLVLCGVFAACSCGQGTKKPVTVGDIIGGAAVDIGAFERE